jgi:Fe-S cluster biogenesis protein NfuA
LSFEIVDDFLNKNRYYYFVAMIIAEDIENRVLAVLDKIRPYLQIDGGDIELVKINENGVVELRLIGACQDCAMKQMTLRAGIERAIMHEITEIKRIECIN